MTQKLLSIALMLSLARAEVLSNGIIGEPKVECGPNSMTVSFDMVEAFEGHIYVKDQYKQKQCKSIPTLSKEASLTVNYDTCQVKKARLVNGIEISSTIVISFHPMFQLKSDRTFNVECFYAHLKNNVENEVQLTISDEGREVLRGKADENILKNAKEADGGKDVLPQCKYEVLSSRFGAPVRLTSIGQSVYHRWSCEYSGTEHFCATVHSCYVHDSNDVSVQLLDENGCAVDKYLLNNLEYTSDMVGGREADVFKFADEPIIYFQCAVRLTLSKNGTCIRSSDTCPSPMRGKRDVTLNEEASVKSQQISVLDVNDSHMNVYEDSAQLVCVTTDWFTVLLFVFFTCTVFVAVLLCLFLVCKGIFRSRNSSFKTVL
ncbi:unnamed protein product [Auanema sp. JU1783]|nr:unnamed protein product [Auanema sp. JU1783]